MTDYYNLPDEKGHFGPYGGLFVSETLMQPLDELRKAYEHYKQDSELLAELNNDLHAKRMGKKRVIAETGAGQHGVASATVAARFGMECVVYTYNNSRLLCQFSAFSTALI